MAALVGKKVVGIGGSSGIGLGVAAAALAGCAEVVLVGRSPEKLQAAERSLGVDRGMASIAADMTKEANIARLFDQVGAFDHLVSTAGAPPPGDPIDRTDMAALRRFIDNKLIGAILVAKHAVRQLKTGGSMTFTSGINKDRPRFPEVRSCPQSPAHSAISPAPWPWSWPQRA